jgi:asparagine N-glycosylation enzyme membrane subunit Stt3
VNIYFLVSGLIAVFLSVAHAVWGESTILAELKQPSLSAMAQAGFYVSWHQTTVLLMVMAVSLIVLALRKTRDGINNAAIIVVSIITGNFLVFLVLSFVHYREMFAQTIPQTVLFVILIVLIVLGIFTRKTPKTA